MGRRSLPPGFRFHPTHVELIMFYLKKKVMQKQLPPGVISDLDIYKYAPWDLPDKSCLKSRDLKWYFFCPRERKYASGARMNRATEFGFWKSTGKDRPVNYNDKEVGQIKTLTFFKGKAPKGEQTDWVMHEYRIEEKNLKNVRQDAYVLCVIFQKDGPGPRNGAQYGAPYMEEEWDNDSVVNDDFMEVASSVGLSVPSILPHREEPESSFPPDTTAPQSNNFGRSSISCVSEILPSTSKKIPLDTGVDNALLEIPQTQENDDILSIEDLPEDGNLSLNRGDGYQSTQNVIHGTAAASNELDVYEIFEGLGDLDYCAGLNEGGHDQMLFLELNDLDVPLNGQISNLTAAYNGSNSIEWPCSSPSNPFESAKQHLSSYQYPLLSNSIVRMSSPTDLGGSSNQLMSASSYSSKHVDDLSGLGKRSSQFK